MTTTRKKKKVEEPKKKREPSNDDELLRESVQSAEDWFTYSNEHILRARNYLSFLYVDQWDMNIRNNRESVNRPCMQFNKVTPVIRSILGEWREDSPALTVRGASKNTKQEDVDIRDGLMRQIHYESDADLVYQIAMKHALECGWGAARICTRYANRKSNHQEIYVDPIVDFQCAFWDPVSQLPDRSDGDYCGVYTTMTKKKFKRLYPKIEDPQGVEPSGDSYYFRWYTVDTITICERYYKDYFTKKVVVLSDDNTVEKEEADEIMQRQEEYLKTNPHALLLGFKPLEISDEYEIQDFTIKYVKFIKNAVLEKKEWPGKILPIVCFDGDSVVIDGERIPIPFIQDAIDQQKMINYIGSEAAYAVLRSRKETAMGTAAMFEGYEHQWRDADQVQGALKYNWDNKAGKPEFVKPPVLSDDLITLYNNTCNDLQQSIGWFDEARGAETNAISGKAIDKRQSASKKPVKVYQNNGERAIEQCGKVILDLIPHIYDSTREIKIRGKDGSLKTVDINKPHGFKMQPNGSIEQNYMNDMSQGDYDIEVRVDGSYDAQMQGALDMMMQLSRAYPPIAQMIPDLLAENSGLENTQKLVNRLKKLLPPDILAEEEGKPMRLPQPQPPDPAIEVQREKNQLGMAQNQTRQNQQELDKQKMMLQTLIALLDRETTSTKANAEIKKSLIDKDAALLGHVTKLAEHHKPTQM